MVKQRRLSATEVIASTRAADGRRDGEVQPAARPVTAPQRPDRAAHVPQDATFRATSDAAVSDGVDHRRRSIALSLGCGALGTTLGLWLLAMTRFMFPNVVRASPTRVKVGYPSDYAPGRVETRFKTRYGLWVVHDQYHGQQQIYALRAVCTHMGCTPNWLAAEQKFKCPCHGSGFAKDGENLEGPAPRPLERFAIRIADDGQIEIDKATTFQEELGQWEDPACYVRV
jgi:cytochrome b6-f complex iron-sulfur subunit